jgi:hypothetical protein
LQLIVTQTRLFAPVAVSTSTRRMSSMLAAAASARRGLTEAGSTIVTSPSLGIVSVVSASAGF